MKSRDIVPFGIARLHSLSRFPSGDFGLRVSQIWCQNMGKRAAYIVFYYGKRKKELESWKLTRLWFSCLLRVKRLGLSSASFTTLC